MPIYAGLAFIPHNVTQQVAVLFVFAFTGFLFKPQTTMCIFLEMVCLGPVYVYYLLPTLPSPVAYPGIFFGGGSTNSVEDREDRDLGAVAH